MAFKPIGKWLKLPVSIENYDFYKNSEIFLKKYLNLLGLSFGLGRPASSG